MLFPFNYPRGVQSTNILASSNILSTFYFIRLDSIYSNALLYIPRPIPSRKYFIDLTPKILFSKSDVLPILVKSRVNRYLEFKPLSSFHTYENDSFDRVPGTKEDIFTDQTLSLMTKRNLMRFMKFVLEYDSPPADGQGTKSNVDLWKPYANKPVVTFMKEKFKLQSQQITELVFSIGLATSPNISTINALARMKRYLVSLGVYGNFPALYSTYGSSGELVQAFSRSAAVAGATYKLNTAIESYARDSATGNVSVKLSDGSKVKVSEQIILSANSAIRIIEQPSSGSRSGNGLAAPPSPGFGAKVDVKSVNSGLTSGIGSGLQQQYQPSQDQQLPRTQQNATDITRMVAIVAKDCKEWFTDGEQAAVVVFPPKTLPSENGYAVQAIIMGSGSGQCPQGQSIWYLSTTESGANPPASSTPLSSPAGSSSRARIDLEEALKKLEASILRESTQDFEFGGISDADVSVRPDGIPVLSSVKLGQSLQNFVPKEKLQYLVKFCYSQKLGPIASEYAEKLNQLWGINVDVLKGYETSASHTTSTIENNENTSAIANPNNGKVTIASCPLAEISYDGVVDQALHIYEKIVGSDDDFFDLDFEDEDEEANGPQRVSAPGAGNHAAAAAAASARTGYGGYGSGASNVNHNESAIESDEDDVPKKHNNDDDDMDMEDDDDHVPDFGDDMELWTKNTCVYKP